MRSNLQNARTSVLQILFAAAVVLAAGSAHAQDTSEDRGTPEQRMACTSDAFRLCWNDIPVVDRIVACLRRNRPQLSIGCRAVFEQDNSRYARHLRRHHRHERQDKPAI
jgi:hypothetical protein